MSQKINDGYANSAERFRKKNVQICLILPPELADAIKEKAYNERLSVNKFMIKCAETYLNLAMNKDQLCGLCINGCYGDMVEYKFE